MSVVERVHGSYVHGRRISVLGGHLNALLPAESRVLDVGCGDGLLAKTILDRRADITIEGIDTLIRDETHVPVREFDGRHIPYDDGSFDVVMFVDVLHHTDDPSVLLEEALRVSRRYIVLKDHTRNGLFAEATLRLMDRVGNARFGVALPYNYWSKAEWEREFDRLDLRPETWNPRLGIYPFPANLAFGRSLHFVARLEKRTASRD